VSPQTARAARVALDLVLIAAATLGAMKLFELGLQQLAGTTFWKTWTAEHSGAGRLVPALPIAVACGLLPGLVLGGFAGSRAWLLACWAGAAVVVLDLGAMIVADGPAGVLTAFALAPLCVALGLPVGAALGTKLMPAPAK